MRFEELMSRADEEILQGILGRNVVRLLMALDPMLATPSRLRDLVVTVKGPPQLLLHAESRAFLLQLLRPTEAIALCKKLEIPTNDPYGRLATLSFRTEVQKQQLLDFFAVETPVAPRVEGQRPSKELVVPAYGLFTHQRQAAANVESLLSSHPYKVLLHMPTGSGKTRTAMNIIAGHLRTHAPTLVIWLAYSEELCEQAAEEFAICWGCLGDRDLPIYRYWGNRSLDVSALGNDGLVVVGLSKAYSTLRNNSGLIMALGSRSTLVVMDEAHQAIAETYQAVLGVLVQLGANQCSLLGLTATPGRSWDDMSADKELANYFDQKKVMLTISGYDNPVDYLVSEGYLAKTSFKSLSYDGGTTITGADLSKIESALDIPDDILRHLGEDMQRNLLIVTSLERLVLSHRRILVFAASVDHSELLACVLQARGLDAYSLTATTPSDYRTSIITGFKSDAPGVKVLCNYGVLTAGFDAPNTSAVFIARPTKSLVLYSQMVGRGIRGPKAGGNRHADIITVVDLHLPGFGEVAEAFLNWEDVWKNDD